MGKEKQGTTSQQTQTQQVQQTPEEERLNQLDLALREAGQEGLLGVQGAGLNLSQLLLKGQPLPGYLGDLPGGISPEAIGAEATKFAREAGPGFQQLGIGDSGVAFRETARGIASDVLFPAEQFNTQNLSQLLNLAIGGQAQVQSPILSGAGMLGQRLGGLRSTTTTGFGSQTQLGMNPFLKSFQTSLGEKLGSRIGGAYQ